jgi:hypothetical protein
MARSSNNRHSLKISFSNKNIINSIHQTIFALAQSKHKQISFQKRKIF